MATIARREDDASYVVVEELTTNGSRVPDRGLQGRSPWFALFVIVLGAAAIFGPGWVMRVNGQPVQLIRDLTDGEPRSNYLAGVILITWPIAALWIVHGLVRPERARNRTMGAILIVWTWLFLGAFPGRRDEEFAVFLNVTLPYFLPGELLMLCSLFVYGGIAHLRQRSRPRRRRTPDFDRVAALLAAAWAVAVLAGVFAVPTQV